MRLFLASLLLLAACDTSSSTTDPDAAATPGYIPLVSGTWSLPPSIEGYRCIRLTAKEDMWITAIHPIAPTGTHHTVLMLGPPDAPDGDVACDSMLVKPSIYASGVGTDALTLPDGVAIKVAAGQQLLLNLHLFNASDDTLRGTSGIEVKTAEASAILHEAGALLAGKDAGLVVKPGSSVQTGTCTLPAGTTVFAMAPHMHLLGTHMKVTYQAAAPLMVYDKDYAFEGQRYEVLDAPLVSDGTNRLVVDCTYMNPTGTTVTFGEHTAQEMCYALTLVYPAPKVRGPCDR
jgi:copper type II ascorbate-dependent monooxygenase-like protein